MAGGVCERDGVADHVAVDEHRPCGLGVALEVDQRDALADLGGVAEAASDHRRLLADRRVVDDDLHQEAVDLRLGQRVGALGLDRVLRGHHQERRAAPGSLAPPIVTWCSCITSSSADCTFAGARLISSASRKLREHRAELGVEAAAVGPVDAGADEVGGHQVGRELDAAEAAAEHLGEGLDGQRLGEARDALEQHVAAGEKATSNALEHRVLADDHALDLVQRVLQRGTGLLAQLGRVFAAGWLTMDFSHLFPWFVWRSSDQASEPAQRHAASDQHQDQRAAGELVGDLALLQLVAEL